jgi:hypothetical protein
MGQHLSRSCAEGNDGRQEKVREVTGQKSDEREKEDATQRNKNSLMFRRRQPKKALNHGFHG